MSTENATPSLGNDPANNDSLAGMLSLVFRKLMQAIDGVTPAAVVGYEAGPPDYVSVQPLVQTVSTLGQTESRAQIARVPVCQIGAGGFVMRFPLVAGDTGLLIACDRDISLFMQSGQQSPPNTNRIKDFGDSFFLPIVLRGYTIANAADAVLQSLDGTVAVNLSSDKITLTAPTVEIPGELIVGGRTIVMGELNTGANITAAGSITPDTPIPP
jgi:protein gp138